jgi:hypothetical protein
METGYGLTTVLVAGALGWLVGSYMAKWELKTDRCLVSDDLERTVTGLRARAQTQADHKELDEVLKGIEDLRMGRIPFESRESFVDKIKATAKGLGKRLNPWGARNGQAPKWTEVAAA